MKKRTPSQRLAGIREALERAGESHRIEISKGREENWACSAAWNELIGALSWLEPDVAEKIAPGVLARIEARRKQYEQSERPINNGAAALRGDE